MLMKDYIRDSAVLGDALRTTSATAIIHFARFKSLCESVQKPLACHGNSLSVSLSPLQAMNQCDLKMLVFRTFANVYGSQQRLPLSEVHALPTTNPFAQTKLVIENMMYPSYQAWRWQSQIPQSYSGA